MTKGKKKPGPKPEVFKVPLPFEDALKVALGTPAPPKQQPGDLKT